MTHATPAKIRAARQCRTTLMAWPTPTALALAMSLATAHATDVPSAQRLSAAQLTAERAANCVAAQPFYWEIGNKERLLASGQAGSNAPTRDTTMSVASASKWIYASYV